ncbi:centromere kinetochore component CENP-T-domain-containing protein [Apiospora arundinis]|uniref:Centromere kinetochore component CENP-T-domain-containing protein n=1 Tax=Apiospora arundinis TaxID=335852 RepID=A0ABR2HR51_9PEZI
MATPSTPGAAVAKTPNRRARSADPNSARQSASARRGAATPHGRAAFAALQKRRTALFTPGKERRRSIRDQRETPRDPLRALSRLLAPSSQAIHSSSSPSDSGANSSLPVVAEEDESHDFDDDSDDFMIERPRLSLNLREDDDEDSELKPPRLSGLEDYTAQSIEMPRRAISELPPGRPSLGSVRESDYHGPDIHSDDIGIDSGFFPPPMMEDPTIGGDSLFPPIEFPDPPEESTFAMPGVESSPAREPMFLEDSEQIEMEGPEDEMDDENENEPFGQMDSDNDSPGPAQQEDTMHSLLTAEHRPQAAARRKKPGKKISKHGIEYPSLPQGVVKRLATTFAKTAGMGKAKISPDTLDAIMQATDWFFEQLGDDLQAYANHAGRKTIDESDMIALMRRQRQTNSSTTPFALAQRHLPRELLQELRMPVPAPVKGPRKKAHKGVRDGAEDDVT